MKLTVTCATYGRPHLLARQIACFEQQTHQDRYMLIFDDGGQLGNQGGDRWRIVSSGHRCGSLGMKRNVILGMVPPDTDAVLPCDDDDFMLPWHLESAAAALEHADWSRPSVVLSTRNIGDTWLFLPTYTGDHDDNTRNRLYAPSHAYRYKLVMAVGGYPEELSGPEDQGLMRRLLASGARQADPIALGFQPSYCYIWGNNNISGRLSSHDPTGAQAWASLERRLAPAKIEPWTPPFDLHDPLIALGPPRQRPF